MTALPEGTVTLLFSDMEGSTTLARTLGDAWPAVLLHQRELCRTVWSDHRGIELGTEGDSFFVVFATAEDAVAAGVAAQQATTTTRWPEGADIRIRIGIHTGTPQRLAEGYAGLDLHKGARISAAAHGGQTLISEATASLVSDRLPADVSLRDRGEQGLKDIPLPVRLFQVDVVGLPHQFPPLRTLGGAGSLPALLTPTVGRDGELAELADVLTSTTRLVTLSGPGGTGKTRLATSLAARVAEDFPDGVFFVPLEAANTGSQMWPALGQVLDVPADKESPPALLDHLKDRKTLLILDNLEQIPDADEVVRRLLNETRRVTMVTTTRRPLHVKGEHDHAVPVLLPDGSLQLFVDHAHRASRGFVLTDANRADIERLCEALDHLPLAIEIAAARVKLLAPAAILSRLDSALDIRTLDRAQPDRHLTVRRAIDWSYQLLEPAHQSVLDHLGVFEGGADLDALERVTPTDDLGKADLLDVLFDLVDASLVKVAETDGGEPRFSLLVSVQRFARERLAARGALDDALDRHAQHFYDLAADWHDRDLAGKVGLLRFLDREAANLGALLDHTLSRVRDPARYGDTTVPPLHVAALLGQLAHAAERLGLQEAWARTGLAMPVLEVDPAGEAALELLIFSALERSERAEESGDTLRTFRAACAQVHDSTSLPRWVDVALNESKAMEIVCWSLASTGQFEAARGELASWRPIPSSYAVEAQRTVLAASFIVAYFAEDYDDARARQRELMALEVSLSRRQHIGDLNNLYCLDVAQGRLRAAQEGFRRAVAELRDDDNPLLWIDLAENFAEAVGTTDPKLFVRVLGMAETFRATEDLPEDSALAMDPETLAPVAALLTEAEWEAAHERGRSESMFDLLRELAGVPLLPPDEGFA